MKKTDNVPISRSWLESLSASELYSFAGENGIDIPVEPERTFIRTLIIEEILLNNVTEDINKNSQAKKRNYSESVDLPAQYNYSFIDAMVRDPLWIYVYWEIKEHDRTVNENADDFKGYCLRIFSTDGEITPEAHLTAGDSCSILINIDDTARYFNFADQSIKKSNCHIISLMAIRGNSELQIAVSRPLKMPKIIDTDTINEYGKNPLLRLSGSNDFTTTKSTDRIARIKG